MKNTLSVYTWKRTYQTIKKFFWLSRKIQIFKHLASQIVQTGDYSNFIEWGLNCSSTKKYPFSKIFYLQCLRYFAFMWQHSCIRCRIDRQTLLQLCKYPIKIKAEHLQLLRRIFRNKIYMEIQSKSFTERLDRRACRSLPYWGVRTKGRPLSKSLLNITWHFALTQSYLYLHQCQD